MLDRYVIGSTERISPEAPIPVVKIDRIEEKPGGAGNVAMNLRMLGANVSLLGLVGDDASAHAMKDTLDQVGVKHHLVEVANRPTITKCRVMAQQQQIVRMDLEQAFMPEHSEPLLTHAENAIKTADILLLSDYGKGTLALIENYIALARAHNKPILIDPKSTDMNLYRGATMITPNFKEFESVVGACKTEDEIAEKAEQLCREYDWASILVTRGAKGMMLIQPEKPVFSVQAHADEVVDVTGAGDTVISTLAACVAAKMPFNHAVQLANTAAGVTVHKLGVAGITVPELRRAMQTHNESGFGMLTEDELATAIADAKAHGEKVVMTNGCFDILHAGHVSFLENAKAKGDRLLVALNDDASVQRLKGPTRPVNPLEKRMSVLAGLRSVDWVVSFSDDTPTRLIEKFQPDVMAKGDDYASVEDVVGWEVVKGYGGEIALIGDTFQNSASSSELIERIKKDESAVAKPHQPQFADVQD